MNQPVPLDEQFVDYVQQQILNRKETGILRSLKKLIQEPLEVDQSIFFRYQSDLSQNPFSKQSQRPHKNSDGKYQRQETAGFGSSDGETVSEGPENCFANLVYRTQSLDPKRQSAETPIFTAKKPSLR